jgi:ribonuclease HI
VKNAAIIRCISTYLDIRSKLGQKVVLEYVKGHSGDLGNDGADAMANQGALLPPTPERDWGALEQQLMQRLDETMPVGAMHAEIVGLEGGDQGESSRGKQRSATVSSPKSFAEQPVRLKSMFEDRKSPTRSSSPRLYEKPSSSPKKFNPAPVHHPSDIKSPQISPSIFQTTNPKAFAEQHEPKSTFEGGKSPTPGSSARLYEEPFSSPTKSHPTILHYPSDIKSPQILTSVSATTSSKPVTEQPKLESVFEGGKSPPTPTRNASALRYEKPSSSPKKPQPTTLHHSSGTKLPLKVTYVSPLFAPVRAQDVNPKVGRHSVRSLNYLVFLRIMKTVFWMIPILPMTFQIDVQWSYFTSNPGAPPLCVDGYHKVTGHLCYVLYVLGDH